MDQTKLATDLVGDEGLRLKPYRCTAGKLTIGVGRNIEDLGISETEALFLLNQDIDRCKAELDKNVGWWKTLPDIKQRALVNMCFNLGINRLLKFRKMLGALQRGDWAEAASQALDSNWAKQVGARSTRIAAMLGEKRNIE